MFCPSCGTKNNYYHRFCFHCGAPLTADSQDEKSGNDTRLQAEQQKTAGQNEKPAKIKSDLTDKTSNAADKINYTPDRINKSTKDTDVSKESVKTDSLVPDRDNTSHIENDGGKKRPAESDALYIETQEDMYEDHDDSRQSRRTGKRNKSDKRGKDSYSYEDYDSSSDDSNISDNDSEYFDMSNQIPLRRYNKDEGGDGLQTLIKICVSVVLIALIAFLCYIGYDQLLSKQGQETPVITRIDFNYEIAETELDGKPARKITILTNRGETVELLNKTIAVVDGRAELIIADSDFDPEIYEKVNGELKITLDAVVKADGYPNRREELEFTVPLLNAPLTVISPAGNEAVVDGSSYQLVLKVNPGSQVFINDDNYSHLVDEDGQLSIKLEIPDEPQTEYSLRVVADGFEDTLDTITFRRKQMEFPLVVNQKAPIKAGDDPEWVEITGNTNPDAILISSLTTKEPVAIDPLTGDFRIYVKATRPGYTPLVLTARLEGKEDSVLDLVIERPTTEADYTSTAWAPVYDDLKAFPNMHNGINFLFKGTIKDISSTGTKSTFIVDTAAEGEAEKLICVDYWGAFNYSIGDRIKVFGNRWGNKNDIPFIIARFLYIQH